MCGVGDCGSENFLSVKNYNDFLFLLIYAVTDDGKKILQNKKINMAREWMRKKANGAFTKKMLQRRLPIIKWLPE